MGTPATFEEQVNTAAASFVKGEDGKLSLPEGQEASEEVIYAAKLEVRRRDTYSSLSKANNENKALSAENSALATQWEADAVQNLSNQQRSELEELKNTDPDAWREKIDTYSDEAKTKFTEKKDEVTKKARNETELDRRVRLVEEYNEANPESQLTDDIIENDVPPRITKQLSDGTISFDEYLTKVSSYLSKEKVITKGTVVEDEPNLSDSGGTSKPTDEAIAGQASDDYKNEIY